MDRVRLLSANWANEKNAQDDQREETGQASHDPCELLLGEREGTNTKRHAPSMNRTDSPETSVMSGPSGWEDRFIGGRGLFRYMPVGPNGPSEPEMHRYASPVEVRRDAEIGLNAEDVLFVVVMLL